MLWILGGWNTIGGSGNTLDSTEFVTTDGAVYGPTLPERLFSTCAVKFIATGQVYLVGGYGYGNEPTYGGRTNNVWVADPSNEFSFTQGPSIMTARSYHGCGTLSIGAKSIIVAAGGVGTPPNSPYAIKLTSVEILDPLTNQWVAGK